MKLEHDDDYLQYEGRAQVNGVLYEFTIDKNTGTFVEWKWKIINKISYSKVKF